MSRLNHNLSPDSPEALIRFLQVVRPLGSLIIVVLGIILGVALTYLVIGRLPITVSTHAVLISPYKIVPIQSRVTGRLEAWEVEPGSTITKGARLATVNQPLFKNRVDMAEQHLNRLIESQTATKAISSRSKAQKREFLKGEDLIIKSRIEKLKDEVDQSNQLSRVIKGKEELIIENKIKALNQLRQSESQSLSHKLITPTDPNQNEEKKDQEPVQTESDLIDQQTFLAQIDAELIKLEMRTIETIARAEKSVEQHLDKSQQITALQLELLDNQMALSRLEQEEILDNLSDQHQLSRSRQHLDSLKTGSIENNHILSPYSGRILELGVTEGSVINPGSQLGSINTRKESDPLVVVAYYPISEGKKLHPGMMMELSMSSPDHSPANEYWLSDPQSGVLIAEVTSVSTMPITQQAAETLLGNQALAEKLLEGQSRVEVIAKPVRETSHPSGFMWRDPKDPGFRLTAGTLLVARTIIRKKPPLEFIFPVLSE